MLSALLKLTGLSEAFNDQNNDLEEVFPYLAAPHNITGVDTRNPSP